MDHRKFVNKGEMMKLARLYVMIGLLLVSGCAYRGNLKENFYIANNISNKLPVRAYLVYDRAIEDLSYQFENIYIDTKPGLRLAIDNAFRSTFEVLHTSSNIDLNIITEYDVVIVPRVEFLNQVVAVSVTLKSTRDNKIINVYKSSSGIYHQTPASVHVLRIINIIPFAGLTTPIIAPMAAEIIGESAEKDLEGVLRSCLNTINDDIRNDQANIDKFIIRKQ